MIFGNEDRQQFFSISEEVKMAAKQDVDNAANENNSLQQSDKATEQSAPKGLTRRDFL